MMVSARIASTPRGSELGRAIARAISVLLACSLGMFGLIAIPAAHAVAAVPTVDWVALGDSYSAGVGLGQKVGECDPDSGAYGIRTYLALKDAGQIGTSSTFKSVACSGAVTGDYWTAQWPDLAAGGQRAAIGSSTDIVTLTFGGNDVSFPSKVYGCVLGDCGPDMYSLSAGNSGGSAVCSKLLGCDGPSSITWDNLFNRLVDVYVDARLRMSAAGSLYVLSYPAPFSPYGGSGTTCAVFSSSERAAGNALGTRLGDTIYLAVQEANKRVADRGRPSNIAFVDWRTGTRVSQGYVVPGGYSGAGSRFDSVENVSTGLCNPADNATEMNGIITSATYNSMHPNVYGYAVAAARLKTQVLNRLAAGDGDGDGLPDSADTCPSQPGPADNGGCPRSGSSPPAGLYVSTCNLGGTDHCTGVNLRSKPSWPGNVIGTLPEHTAVSAVCWNPGTSISDANGLKSDAWVWIEASGGRTGYISLLFLWGPAITIRPCGPLPTPNGDGTVSGPLVRGAQATFKFPFTNRGVFNWEPSSVLVSIQGPGGHFDVPCADRPKFESGGSWTCVASVLWPSEGRYTAHLEFVRADGSRSDGAEFWTPRWGWENIQVQDGPLQFVGVSHSISTPVVGTSNHVAFQLANSTNVSSSVNDPRLVVHHPDGTSDALPCIPPTKLELKGGESMECSGDVAVSQKGGYAVTFSYRRGDGSVANLTAADTFYGVSGSPGTRLSTRVFITEGSVQGSVAPATVRYVNTSDVAQKLDNAGLLVHYPEPLSPLTQMHLCKNPAPSSVPAHSSFDCNVGVGFPRPGTYQVEATGLPENAHLLTAVRVYSDQAASDATVTPVEAIISQTVLEPGGGATVTYRVRNDTRYVIESLFWAVNAYKQGGRGNGFGCIDNLHPYVAPGEEVECTVRLPFDEAGDYDIYMYGYRGDDHDLFPTQTLHVARDETLSLNMGMAGAMSSSRQVARSAVSRTPSSARPKPIRKPVPVPAAQVFVKAVSKGSKVHIDVNPDKGSGFWSFRVEKRKANGKWKALKTYRTKGTREIRTINLSKGTYRVRVAPKYGRAGAISKSVMLRR